MTDIHQWCICDIGMQVKRSSSNMAAASYDQLLRQVEVLKMENSNLRQELQDNSNHLTKLETEASNMKVGRCSQNYSYTQKRLNRSCLTPNLQKVQQT